MTLDWKIRGTITYASIALDGILFFLLFGVAITAWVLHRQQRFGLGIVPIKTFIICLLALTM
jgi:hypothetical protein